MFLDDLLNILLFLFHVVIQVYIKICTPKNYLNFMSYYYENRRYPLLGKFTWFSKFIPDFLELCELLYALKRNIYTGQ